MNDGCDFQNVPTRTSNIRKYYRMIAEVGSGTYGRVYKAECLRTKQYVALKKFESKDEKVKEDGFPITAVREIRLLKQLDHVNVIKLREVIVSKPQDHNDYRGSTFLVFDYMDHDFAGLHRNKHEFTLSELKCVMVQILKGVQYLHSKRVIHRDLKIANILYNNEGQVKIADFGLARMLNPANPKYTNKVVTLWYRAPEILLGAKEYSQQVDMWSVGCIFIELAVRENLLRGENEQRQIDKIYELCGGVNISGWPEVEKLQHWKDLKPKRTYDRRLREVLIEKKKNIDPELLNLIDKLMVLNPKKRFNVQQCLEHPFFSSEPLPLDPSEMSKIKEECHEALLKNIYNRNQVIASQKSTFLPRPQYSPSRVPQSIRLQQQQQFYQAQQILQQMPQQPSLQTSRSANYALAQSQQFIGAGHFENRNRYSNSGGPNSNNNFQNGRENQNNLHHLQRSNSSNQGGSANGYGRPRFNSYLQKKGSIDNNNDFPSIELHLGNNNQQSKSVGNDGSTSKHNSFSGLVGLVQNQGSIERQNYISHEPNNNGSHHNNNGGSTHNNTLLNSGQKLQSSVHAQYHHHLHDSNRKRRNFEEHYQDIVDDYFDDDEDDDDEDEVHEDDQGLDEEERLQMSQLRRSSNPLAMLASSQPVHAFSHNTNNNNNNNNLSHDSLASKLAQKRHSPPNLQLEPLLKKKLKDE